MVLLLRKGITSASLADISFTLHYGSIITDSFEELFQIAVYFTFHYASIITACQRLDAKYLGDFRSQYASIKTINRQIGMNQQKSLASNMLLLRRAKANKPLAIY